MATVTAVPAGGSARIADSWYVPAAWPRTMNPPSIASAPIPVTSSACSAAARAVGVGVLVADEQERRDRRQLPEPVEHEQVVGEDEADHRPGEQHEQPEQAHVGRRRVVEVAPRVGDDEHADAGDEEQHQRGEPVEAQVEVDAELGDPLDVLGAHLAVDDVGEGGEEPAERGRRRDGGDDERGVRPGARPRRRRRRGRAPTTRWSSSRVVTGAPVRAHRGCIVCTTARRPCPGAL